MPPVSPQQARSRAWWGLFLGSLGVLAGIAYLSQAPPPAQAQTTPAPAEPARPPQPAAPAPVVPTVTVTPQVPTLRVLPVKPVPLAKAEPPPAPKVDDEGDKKGKKKKKDKDEDERTIDQFFSADGPIPTFILWFDPEEWEYLKKDPRRFAEADLWEQGHAGHWKGVAIRCKGSAGSFQNPDGRPGLTLSMNKYKGADKWSGFTRWHLNNGAQDNSLLNEQISCEIARAAGVPASRCSHALLKFQGRDLGLYLFKESFDEPFLAKLFKDPTGDLYDGGFVRDLDVNMEKDVGDPRQRDNIKELIAAAQEQDQTKRWERLEKILDIDAFLSFTAVESLIGHWDGYNFNKNNYRVYFDKTTGKACFFLHGTDQVFTDAGFPVARDPGSLIGGAVMSNPAWKKAYRERSEKIYYEVLKPIDWPARVVEIGRKVRAALQQANEQWAREYDGKIEGARARVAGRIAAIGKQFGEMPKPVPFGKDGVLTVAPDAWRQEGTAATMDTATRDGKTCLHLRADGDTTASWRQSLSLEAGKYRLEARAVSAGIVPTESPAGKGAGLRISGGTRTAPNELTGDAAWRDLAYEFETGGGEVALVAELRASKGEVWFDRETFRVRKLH